MRRCLSLTATVALVLTGSVLSFAPLQSAKPVADGSRPALTAELQQWVSEGRNKLTEDEVIARLGPPDVVENPIDPDSNRNPIADIAMTWQDLSIIEIVFKDDRAKQISGRFSTHLKARKANLMNFRKLKTGASRFEIEQVLGVADAEVELAEGRTRHEWGAQRVLKVNFKDGKVTGTQWQSRG